MYRNLFLMPYLEFHPYPGMKVMYVKLYVFWNENSNFVIKNKFLDTWQLLDPAGSQPDPGIEVTYPKINHVCKIL